VKTAWIVEGSEPTAIRAAFDDGQTIVFRNSQKVWTA